MSDADMFEKPKLYKGGMWWHCIGRRYRARGGTPFEAYYAWKHGLNDALKRFGATEYNIYMVK